MHFAPVKAIFSLKFRIVAWMTLLVLLAVIVSSVVVAHLYQDRLRQEFRHQLEQDVKAVLEELRIVRRFPDGQIKVLEEALTTKAIEHPLTSWFVQIFDGQGSLVLEAGGVPKITQPLTAQLLRGEYERDQYRIVEARLDDSQLPTYLVRVGAQLATLQNDFDHLKRILIYFGLAITALTPAIAFVLAHRATRPIAWITSTAARLQPHKLDERLPIRGSRDELDELSVTINQLLDRIAKYLQQNREFVANAAHELRSPLAAIRASVEVALNRPRTSEEYASVLTDLVEETTRLSQLVNQLLLLAEGDSGAMAAGNGQKCRLEKVVAGAFQMFEPVAEHGGITLQFHAPGVEVWVPGEERFLQQVVRNLIDNAIKFTRPGGRIDVTLSCAGGKVRLEVRDQGFGISADDVPHLFERFYRGDKSRRRSEGTGLGLSICHTIVEALGGTITVRSQPEAGSAFTVTLPHLVV